jgi:hypothetical protein
MSGNLGGLFTLEANDARRELDPEDALGAAKLPLRCKFDADPEDAMKLPLRCKFDTDPCRCKIAGLAAPLFIENER